MRSSFTKVVSTLVALAALFTLLPLAAFAQDTGAITGQVTDGETDNPLPGASILVEELGRGTATDANGEYTIEDVPEGTYTLQGSFVGYKNTEETITVNAGEMLQEDLTLAPDLTGLEEVVVTGLASKTSRSRSEVAVSSVNADELTDKASYTGVADLLAGKVAGLNVKKTSGNIGGGFRFDVRSGGGLNGSGQPVIYIDGVRVDNADVEGFATGGQGISTLSNLNPEDIKNIEVLKGPAGAALYGTSGSNGVVLITTKSGGSTGQQFSVRYKSVLGVNQQIEDYDFTTSATPDVANSVFRDGFINKQSVSVSGGTDLVNYFGSYSYSDEEGAIPNNEGKLNSFRANFEAFPLDNLTAKVTAGYSKNNLYRPQNDNNIFGVIGNVTLTPQPFAFVGGDSTALGDINNVQRYNNFNGSVNLNYTPVEGLELRASGGYQGTELRNDETVLRGSGIFTVTNGSRNVFERRNEQYTVDASARYHYGFLGGDLNATTIAGTQLFARTLRTFNIQKQNFSTALITNVSAGSDFIGGDSDFLDTREAGIFAQQEINYADQYFLTLGLRRDYATSLGTQSESIYYPKVSAAWRLGEYDAAPDYVDLFKLRAAYGATGQLPGRTAAIPLLYQAESSAYGAGATLNSIGNPNLDPERVREFEVGFDADLFGTLGLGFTYYRQNAENSIIRLARAPSTGLTASDVPFNIGAKKGQGVEATADYTVFRSDQNSLTLNAKYAYQTNTVTDLGGAQPIRGGFDLVYTKVGLPQYAFYGYQSEASFNDQGEFTGAKIAESSRDADGNLQREFFGTPVPNHSGSLSLNFRFLEDFNLYALADFAGGLKVYNGTRSFAVNLGGVKARNEAAYRLGLPFLGGGFPYADDGALEDANYPYLTDDEFGGLEPGTDAYREAAQQYASLASSVGGIPTDGNFVEDADYIKLREISLSYDISDLINQIGGLQDYVDRASFAVAARNILTFTDYGGVDPEINYSGSRTQTRGYDFLTLAPPRTITGTLTLRF